MSSAIRAIITSNSSVGGHTEYCVELSAGNAKLSSVYRRFREFQELHMQLKKSKHNFEIPECPPKKFFGRTNPEFVLKRQQELQVYLDQLLYCIVNNPPAESAWRLLCLFLALDPKQFVPEAILRLAGQNGSNENVTSLLSESSGSGIINDVSILAPIINDPGAQQDLKNAAEVARMEKIVEKFARQTININRHSEERFQVPSAELMNKIDLDKLEESLNKYILSTPFNNNTNKNSVTSDDNDDNDIVVEENHSQKTNRNDDRENTQSSVEDIEDATIDGIVGAQDLIVSLENLNVHASN